ncbi:MAG TPA: tRNA (guanosine(37)-N1)-methyltransferase TrmD [Chloroflexota bacterium]
MTASDKGLDGAWPEASGIDKRPAVTIVSLFPSMFESWLRQGVTARAIERGIARVDILNLRPFGVGRHHVTDDYPFGGGPGMVMKPEPLFEAVESLAMDADTPLILLSPHGRKFDQRVAERLAAVPRFVLIAGHYEGVDERVRRHLVTDDLSIGDYVLSAGELAAMVVSDAVIRLLPGALAESSTLEESFTSGLLEYPQYTRPAEYRGWQVPEVLLSGHHGAIRAWRRQEALHATARVRPDLLQTADLDPSEMQEALQWAESHQLPTIDSQNAVDIDDDWE